MANQAVGFGTLLAGGILVTAAITGASLADVATGKATGRKNLAAPDDGAANEGAAPSSNPSSPKANTGDKQLDTLIKNMNVLDQRNNAGKLTYQYGGGHSGLVDVATATALDCSAAVSAVLGINPRDSTQFESWGESGAGRRVTVWANATHVLLEVDGNFWGTSAANPGGGAGWIPSGHISQAYLMNFTARHPRGL